MAVEDRARSSKIEQDHALSDTLTVADADHRQFPRRAREPPRTAPRRRRAWGRRTPGGIDSACAGMADDERPGRPQASRSSSCRPGGRGPGGRADAVRYRRWRPGRRRCRGHPCGRHMFGSGGSRARRRGGELDVTLEIWPELWRVFHLFAPSPRPTQPSPRSASFARSPPRRRRSGHLTPPPRAPSPPSPRDNGHEYGHSERHDRDDATTAPQLKDMQAQGVYRAHDPAQRRWAHRAVAAQRRGPPKIATTDGSARAAH
jgi:hypothetical protein